MAKWLQKAQRSQWRAYRKLPSLFLMVPSLTPTTSPFPRMGVPYTPNIREWPYLCNGDPIHFMFGSRVVGWGFRGRRIERRYLRFDQIQDGGRRHLGKFQMAISPQPVVRSTSCLVIGGVFGDGGSNVAIFDSNQFKMAAAAILGNFEWPYLRNGSRSSRGHLCDSTAFLFSSMSAFCFVL